MRRWPRRFFEVGWKAQVAVGGGRRRCPCCLLIRCLLAHFAGPRQRVGLGLGRGVQATGCWHSSVPQVSRRTAILIRHGESVWNEAQVRPARRAGLSTDVPKWESNEAQIPQCALRYTCEAQTRHCCVRRATPGGGAERESATAARKHLHTCARMYRTAGALRVRCTLERC